MKIKLLYIVNGLTGSGGLERVLSIKATYLADNLNYEVHIITLNEEEKKSFYKFSPKIIIHNININGNFILYTWRYISRIGKALKIIRPDMISVCDDGLKGFFLPILLRNPCPMIYERHASINLNFSKEKSNMFFRFTNLIQRKMMNYGGKTFKYFVVLTNSNLKEWDLSNKIVIGNPLSFYPSILSTVSEKKVIVVGSHSYNKGYDILLQSWQIVNTKYPDWQLEIFGKYDASKTYIKMAHHLKLNTSITFFNPVPNIIEKYQKSSIMVLPSRSEGFGMVLIEAMACGVPCVSFNCPHGPSDIIRDGVDGFLVAPEDGKALANKIIHLIENYEIRKKMGIAAHQNVRRYMTENILPQWNNLFQGIYAYMQK